MTDYLDGSIGLTGDPQIEKDEVILTEKKDLKVDGKGRCKSYTWKLPVPKSRYHLIIVFIKRLSVKIKHHQ